MLGGKARRNITAAFTALLCLRAADEQAALILCPTCAGPENKLANRPYLIHNYLNNETRNASLDHSTIAANAREWWAGTNTEHTK